MGAGVQRNERRRRRGDPEEERREDRGVGGTDGQTGRLAREHRRNLQRHACTMPTPPTRPVHGHPLAHTQYKRHHHQAGHQQLQQTPGLITIHLFPSSRGMAAGLGDLAAWVTAWAEEPAQGPRHKVAGSRRCQ